MELDIVEINRNTMKLHDHLYKALKQRDQYKRERDSLLKDIDFLHQLRKGDCSALDTLKAGNNHLIYERDELIKDVEKQRELLKDFSRFIHRKVEACPGKPEYMDFRDRLNELGIGERE